MKVNLSHHHVSPTPGESHLTKFLGEDVSSFLCKWLILQRYHLVMHQDPDVVHVYLNVLGPLSLH